MKNRMLKRIVKIVLIILTFFVIFRGNVFAAPEKIDINGFGGDSSNTNAVSNTLGKALYVFQVAGMGIAAIMLVALGIKFMVASPGERAEIKKHLTIYVFGAVLMFGASGISALIRNFFIDSL